jgi:uncharacterized protein
LRDKVEQARRLVAGHRRVIVAFSGGVDSTLVLKLARDVLGKEAVLAVTADSPSIARADLEAAKRLARELDVGHRVVAPEELAREAYWCKRELFEALQALAEREGYGAVLYGAIGDDVAAERPGQRAAAECSVHAPLQEAGLSKVEVRQLARELGLSNWDRPQNACLASRIPHGSEVSAGKLGQVEAAESFLRAEGFRQVRVRHLGTAARIEVEPDAVARFADARLRAATAAAFAQLGFARVGVRRSGYRPGSANESSPDEEFL